MKIQYNRNRYLDYYTGRWLTEDPAGYIDGMSLYENIVSNPLIYLDPYGLKSKCKEGDIDVKIKKLNYVYMSGLRLVAFSEDPILTIYISKSGKITIPDKPVFPFPITWEELIELLIQEDKYKLLPKCISTEHIHFWQLRYNFSLDVDIRECECKCYVPKWYFWKECIQWGWEDWRSETVLVQTDWLGDAGISLQGGVFGGVLWGVHNSRQYTQGRFNTVTIPGSAILTTLKDKIDTVISQFYTDMFLFPPGTPGSEITAFRNAARQSISHHTIGARLIFSFHFADDFSVFGFTWGAAVSLGRGLLISYSRTKAEQRSPSNIVCF